MKSKQPLVSVIIPTWNRAKELLNAVRSVAQQTYKNLEIIVVDDGGTDDTREQLNALHDMRITYLRIDHSGLPAVVRNTGIKKAKGYWVAFLDSDDQWIPTKLATQISFMKQHQALMTSTNVYKNNRKSKKGMYGHVPTTLTFTELIVTNWIVASTVVIQRSLLNNLHGFPENVGYKAFEDWILWMRISTVTPILYLTTPLAIYRDNPAASIRSTITDYISRLNYLKTDIIRWGLQNWYWHPHKRILCSAMMHSIKYYVDGEQI